MLIKYSSYNVSPYLLSVCLSALIFGVGLAQGDIRDDISNLKQTITKIEAQIIKIDKEIISQKNTVVGKEVKLENAKTNEKAWRQSVGESWTSQNDWNKAKKQLSDAERELTEAQRKLQLLLNDRNVLVKRIDSIKKEIDNLENRPTPRPTNPTLVGMSLDNTCLTYIKNNITTNCPTYEELMLIFPDNSSPISGIFGYMDGMFQRLPTKTHDHFEFYRYHQDNIIFIDPPPSYRDRILMIEIKSNLGEYKLPKNQGYNTTEHSITLGQFRYVNPGCTKAVIDADTYLTVLGDTYYYMVNGCDPKYTNLETVSKEYLQKIEHDITTSYKYQLEKWQKESLLKCGTKICINAEG